MTCRPTIDCPAPLPLSHLTLTERFAAFERGDYTSPAWGAIGAQVTEWALAVGLLGYAPKTPVPYFDRDALYAALRR